MAKSIKNDKLLKSIALVSLVFAGVMCILVIANYFQLSRVDPVNSEVINQLVERLNENPADQQLKVQIREMDLLARKAYFTNKWQIRYGSYLILISMAIFVIIYQFLGFNRKQEVDANPDAPKDILGIQKNARVGIAILGSVMLVLALLLGFLSQKKLDDNLDTVLNEAPVEQSESEQIATGKNPDILIEEKVIETSNEAEELATPAFLESKGEEVEAIIPEKDKPAEIIGKEEKMEETIAVSDKTEEPVKEFPTIAELKKNASTFRAFNGNGIVYQSNVPVHWNGNSNENILWKSPVALKSYNSPIVWEDKIFLAGANASKKEIYCYDKSSGKLLWTHLVSNIEGSPITAPKTTEDTGLGAPTLTTDGNLVYAIFGTGDLLAVNMEGQMEWGKNLGVPQNHYGHSSSLIMHREKLIVQYDQKSGGQVMAFKGKTGQILWSTTRNVKISWASPSIITYEGKSQLILVADPLVAAYSPYTGKELWSVNCIFGEVGPSVCYDDGIVYAVNEYATLAAIDLKDPTKVLWENQDILSDIPSPVAANGLLIMPTSYGLLGCFDGKTGELLWEHEFDDNIYSSPLVVGNRVYLMDTAGLMHIFELSRESYKSIADSPLGEEVVTTPAIADGRIYIRTDKNLYCIGKN